MHYESPNLASSENNAQIRPREPSGIILHSFVFRSKIPIVLLPFPLLRSAHRVPERAGGTERIHSLQPAPIVRSYYTYWGGTIHVTLAFCPNLSPLPIYVPRIRTFYTVTGSSLYGGAYFRIAFVCTGYFYAYMVRFLSNVCRDTLSAHFPCDVHFLGNFRQ